MALLTEPAIPETRSSFIKPIPVVLKVRVTWRDIFSGERGSAQWCPVARAIKRVYDGPVLVLPGTARLDRARIPLPANVQGKIYRFDTKRRMTPFTFTLEV